MSDIVERLKALAVSPVNASFIGEASNEIERNRAAIAELVGALKPFADAYDKWDGGRAVGHFSKSVDPCHFYKAWIAITKHQQPTTTEKGSN